MSNSGEKRKGDENGDSNTSKKSKAVAQEVAGLYKNEHGLEYVKLVHPNTNASSIIYLYGGVVTSYIDGNNIEYIAVRPDAKMDGTKPISGGLSHCWPQFGPGDIQQHGFARNVNWTIICMTNTMVVLKLIPTEYTKAMWDKSFECIFTVDLRANQLDTKLSVKNTGDVAWTFQAALHSYYSISSLENLEITGSFKGKEFLNRLANDGKGEIQKERDIITVNEDYDRVYTNVNDPILKDKAGKSLSILNTSGWIDTVIWNPYGKDNMGYNNFICIESVKYDPFTLDDGNSEWVGEMTLKPITTS